MPDIILQLYGVTPTPTDMVFARMLGGEFLSYAALTWIGRNLTEYKGQKAIVLACLIGFSIGFVVLLIGQCAGVFNILGWSLAAVYFLFSAGYTYFFFAGKQDEA